MGNEIALLLPLSILIIFAILYFFTRKININLKIDFRPFYGLLFLISPFVILITFFAAPQFYIAIFYELLTNFRDEKFYTKIYILFLFMVFLSYTLLYILNIFSFLLRRITWRQFYTDPFADLSYEIKTRKQLLTPEIIFTAILDLEKNFSTYFIFALPAFIANFTHTLIFTYLASDILNYFSLIIVYFFNVITIVNIHRYIVLKEKVDFDWIVKNISIYFKYFIYGLGLLTIGLSPSVGSFFIIFELYYNLNDYSLTFGYFLSLSLVLIIISGIFLLYTYPCFAFILPMISIKEKFTLIKGFRSTKNFRISIFLQFIFIYLFFEILSSLISYLFVTNIRIGDTLIFALISQFFWTIPFIITVSCLSYTYIRYQEGTKI